MHNAPERRSKTGTRSAIATESVRGCSRTVRRHLLHLSSVYQGSSGYYREALRPVIRKIITRLEGER